MNKARDLGNSREVSITTASGKNINVNSSEILVALGRSINTEGLGLEHIGVEYSRKGIEVDKRLHTSQKHIYAAGDVIGGYQFTHAAGYEGGIVISNAVFHLPRKTDYTWMPWCTYTGPELASIGMNEKMAQAAGVEYRVWTENFGDNDRSLAEGEETGKIKLLIGEKGKPVGVQILGPHAGDLLAEWVAVLNGGLKLSGLAGSIHPYPTIAEINKKVVGAVFSEKIFSDKIKKGLKFLFNFKGRACDPKSCG
jgi:pyruvate/2-oxoglutarate dehydrogenase complex dihydrolipoamide dehydrogenase (E3) component